MPTCPIHRDVSLKRTGNGWYCPCCDRAVIIDGQETLPGIDLEPLPSFLALPLTAWAAASDPFARLWKIVYAVESLVRYLVAIGVADWMRRGGLPEELRARLAGRMERPTFGAWMGVARELLVENVVAGAAEPSAAFANAQRAYRALAAIVGSGNDPYDKRLLPLRNQVLAHGGCQDLKEAERQLDECGHEQRALGLFRGEQRWLGEHIVLHVAAAGHYRQLRGPRPEATTAGPFAAEVRARLDDAVGSVVLLDPEGNVLDLGPLCAFGIPEIVRAGGRRVRGQAEVPEVFFRAQAATLLYSALGGKPPFAERVDTVERFRALFGAAPGESMPGRVAPTDFWPEFEADSSGCVGRGNELRYVVGELRKTQSGVFWLAGTVGIGKSMLTAAVACHRKIRGDRNKLLVIPHRFRVGDARCTRAAFLRQAVAALQAWQPLAGHESSEAPLEPTTAEDTELERRFGALLQRVADLPPRSRDPRSRPPRVLLILDGLDEIAAIDAGMVEFPLRHRRDNVIWLLTGRPEAGLGESMSLAIPLFPTEAGLAGGLPPMSDGDIRAMLLTGAERICDDLLARDREEAERIRNDAIEAVATRAAGLPIYVKLVFDDLVAGNLRVDRLVDDLPESLEAYCEELLRRYGIDDLHQVLTPLVASLVKAEEPLGDGALAALLARRGLIEPGGEGPRLVRRALGVAGAMLRLGPLAEGGSGYTLYHDSFRRHVCTSERTRQAVLTAANALADAAAAWQEQGLEPAWPFLFRRGIGMLCARDERVTAARLLTSLDYLRSRLRVLDRDGLPGLFDDYASVLHQRVGTEDPSRKALPDEVFTQVLEYYRFFRRHAAYIASRPDGIVAQALFDADFPEVRCDAEGLAATAGPRLQLVGSALPGSSPAVLWHEPTCIPTAVALSASGRTLVTGDGDGVLRTIDAVTGLEERTHETGGAPIRALAVTPEGSRVAVAHAGGAVGLWDVAAKTYRPFTGLWRIRVVQLDDDITDDLNTWFFGYSDGTLAMRTRGDSGRRTRTDEEVAADPIDRLWGQRVTHHIERLSSGGVALTDCGRTGRVLFDPVDDPQARTTAVLDREPGRTAFSGHIDGTIREWNLETEQEIDRLQENAAIVYLGLTPDQGTLIAATADGLIGQWNLEQRNRKPLLDRQGDRQRSAVAGDGSRWGASWQDGNRLVFTLWTRADDGTVHRRSASTDAPTDAPGAAGGFAVEASDLHVVGTAESATVAVSDDGATLIAAGGNDFQGCRVATWHTEAPDDPVLLVGCQDEPTALAPGPGGLVAVGSSQGEVWVWEGATGRVVARHDFQQRINALGFADGRTLLLLHGAFLEPANMAKLTLEDDERATEGAALTWSASDYCAATTWRGTLVVLAHSDNEAGLVEFDSSLQCLGSTRSSLGLGAYSFSAMALAPDVTRAVLVCPKSGIYAMGDELFSRADAPQVQPDTTAPPYAEIRLACEDLIVGREDESLERGRERIVVWDAASCKAVHVVESERRFADWTVTEDGREIHLLPNDDGPVHRVRISKKGSYTPLWMSSTTLGLVVTVVLLLAMWVNAILVYLPYVIRHPEILGIGLFWTTLLSDWTFDTALVALIISGLYWWILTRQRRRINRTISSMRLRRLRPPARVRRRPAGEKGIALSRNGRWAVVAKGDILKVLDLDARFASRRRDVLLVRKAEGSCARVDCDGRWIVIVHKYASLTTAFIDRPWPHGVCHRHIPGGTGEYVVFEVTEDGLAVFRTLDGGLELRLADPRLCEASSDYERRSDDVVCPWKGAGMCPLVTQENGHLVPGQNAPCTLRLEPSPDPEAARDCASRVAKPYPVRSSPKFGLVVFSHDGGMVSTESAGSISIWTLPEGLPIARLEGHTARVNDIAFSVDKHRLVSTSDDGTVRLWDLDEARELASLHLPSRPGCCAIARNGRIAVSLVEGPMIFLDYVTPTPV